MDTTNHAVEGFLVGFIILMFINIPAAIVFGIFNAIWGVLPDARSDIRFARIGKWDEQCKRMYEDAHAYKIWWLNIVPGSLLHISLDKLGHGEGKNWWANESNWDYFFPWKWREAMWLESVTWLINVILIILLVIFLI